MSLDVKFNVNETKSMLTGVAMLLLELLLPTILTLIASSLWDAVINLFPLCLSSWEKNYCI